MLVGFSLILCSILVGRLSHTALYYFAELCADRWEVCEAEIGLKGIFQVDEESLVISNA